MNKTLLTVGLVFAMIAYIGRMHKDNQKAIRIAELEGENRTLKSTLCKANSDITLANQIIAGDSAGTLLKGANGKVIHY